MTPEIEDRTSEQELRSIIGALQRQSAHRPFRKVLKDNGLPGDISLTKAAALLQARAARRRQAFSHADSQGAIEDFERRKGRHVCSRLDGRCTRPGIHVLPPPDPMRPIEPASNQGSANKNPTWKRQLDNYTAVRTKEAGRAKEAI